MQQTIAPLKMLIVFLFTARWCVFVCVSRGSVCDDDDDDGSPTGQQTKTNRPHRARPEIMTGSCGQTAGRCDVRLPADAEPFVVLH